MRKFSVHRGQSALELLVILAVGLIVLGLVISTSQERLSSSQQALAFSIAKSSVNELAKAADSVYYEGVGARREVQFKLPEGTLATAITANSINIKVAAQTGSSDAVANTQANICINSQLPSKPGEYSIAVESLDNCIAIGALSNLTVSTTLISASAYPPITIIRSLNYSNLGDDPILVNLNLTFDSTDVVVDYVNPADQTFILNGGETKEVKLSIDLLDTALGTYSGTIEANGDNGDNLITSIVVEVFGQSCEPSTCPPGGSPVSLIKINTYSSNTYSQKKEIFDPPEEVLIQGANWGASTSLTLDVRDPTDTFSLPGYPQVITTNSTGGFSDTLSAVNLESLAGYIVKAQGEAGGTPKTRVYTFDVLACS